MILDGVMMIITVTLLTAAHPGRILGDMWNIGAFTWRTKQARNTKGLMSTASNDSVEMVDGQGNVISGTRYTPVGMQRV